VFNNELEMFREGKTNACLKGWTTQTARVQATKRLRLGTLVTGIHYRHPAALANMAAALDIISNGRLELGIGAGWNEEESGTYGIELGTLKERFARFEEACGVLTSLLGAETTDLTYWLRVVPASGATQRRSPCPPTFLDADRNYGQVVEDATGLAAEGLDLGIVYIPTPHDPAVLEPLAEAIRDSGLQDS